MILHTILSAYDVMLDEHHPLEFKSIALKQGRLDFIRRGEEYILCRLDSTNPYDYLDPRYAVGTPFKIVRNKGHRV